VLGEERQARGLLALRTSARLLDRHRSYNEFRVAPRIRIALKIGPGLCLPLRPGPIPPERER
jgi:hypothetical protein